MKISEVRMWGFRCFRWEDSWNESTPNPIAVSFDPEITALIGRNGSGKSALLEALQRLFGETREERTVRSEDFFVPPGETIDKYPKAADWEAALTPILTRHGVALRNEDRNVGGASIQDLMTEPYAQTIIEGVEFLLRTRGGSAWGKVLDTLIELEGFDPDEEPELVQELSERLNNFHNSKRVGDLDLPSAVAASNLVKEVEAFFGLPALKGSAPQYQQDDFFEGIRRATKTFRGDCADLETSWDGVIARYRGDDQVPLMTITKSKGLEYNIVVLLGLDDAQWWSFKINPTEGHSTFFVAASRARERLFLTIRRGQQTSKVSEIYKLLEAAGVKVIEAKNWVFSS
jgi:superfamily I DNA/RNA helicase